MHRLILSLAALATFLVVPSAVHAQGSGSSGGPPSGGYPASPNFETSRSVEGEIVEIHAGEGYLVLARDEKLYRVDLSERVKLKADKKTGLNRKDLRLEDFPVGGRVKLTYRTSDGQLLEMRLRERKKS